MLSNEKNRREKKDHAIGVLLGEFLSLSPVTMILQITLLRKFCGFYTLEYLSNSTTVT